jgi:hypothetical protein
MFRRLFFPSKIQQSSELQQPLLAASTDTAVINVEQRSPSQRSWMQAAPPELIIYIAQSAAVADSLNFLLTNKRFFAFLMFNAEWCHNAKSYLPRIELLLSFACSDPRTGNPHTEPHYFIPWPPSFVPLLFSQEQVLQQCQAKADGFTELTLPARNFHAVLAFTNALSDKQVQTLLDVLQPLPKATMSMIISLYPKIKTAVLILASLTLYAVAKLFFALAGQCSAPQLFGQCNLTGGIPDFSVSVGEFSQFSIVAASSWLGQRCNQSASCGDKSLMRIIQFISNTTTANERQPAINVSAALSEFCLQTCSKKDQLSIWNQTGETPVFAISPSDPFYKIIALIALTLFSIFLLGLALSGGFQLIAACKETFTWKSSGRHHLGIIFRTDDSTPTFFSRCISSLWKQAPIVDVPHERAREVAPQLPAPH